MTFRISTGPSEKPDVAKLNHEPRFRKILELEFSDMIPFVLANIRKPGIVPWIYMIINITMLIFIVFYTIWGLTNQMLTWSMVIRQSLWGIFAGSILIILPHELLHGVAYRILGARKIRFGADMKQFIFYVTADQFPITGIELVFLALTPFIVVNAIAGTLLFNWFPQHMLSGSLLLLSHNIMCIGDFALVSYVSSAKRPIYTYDEIKKKKSYFFEKV